LLLSSSTPTPLTERLDRWVGIEASYRRVLFASITETTPRRLGEDESLGLHLSGGTILLAHIPEQSFPEEDTAEEVNPKSFPAAIQTLVKYPGEKSDLHHLCAGFKRHRQGRP